MGWGQPQQVVGHRASSQAKANIQHMDDKLYRPDSGRFKGKAGSRCRQQPAAMSSCRWVLLKDTPQCNAAVNGCESLAALLLSVQQQNRLGLCLSCGWCLVDPMVVCCASAGCSDLLWVFRCCCFGQHLLHVT
jgi:hypothetical protein